MKRRLTLVFLALWLMSMVRPNVAAPNEAVLPTVPGSASVTVRLLKSPGLNLPGSKWEIAYEFRMLPESSLWSERAKLREGSTERAGDLIKKGTLERSLTTASGQNFLLAIPFSADVINKLKNQPKDRLAPGADTMSQIFVFYSVITVRDARLKKTLTIPVTRVWDYANFPEALFEVNLEIRDDESYSVKSSSIGIPGLKVQRRMR